MAQEFRNVVLIGAAGDLGTPLLRELLKAGQFNVTVLSRPSSTSTYAADVKVIKTDFTEEALVEAFQGQDAVIVSITSTQAEQQYPIINAAAKAGVKRFLPSEFGLNTANKRTAELCPIVPQKQRVHAHLQATAEAHPSFSYTNVSAGPFFDWGLTTGFLGADLKSHTFTIWDDGNRVWSTTVLSSIARAVVAVLQHPDAPQTRNRHVFISSFDITQNQLLSALERTDPDGAKWTVNRVSTTDQIVKGREERANGDAAEGMEILVLASTFGDGPVGSDFLREERDGLVNELLGVPRLDLDDVVKEVVSTGKHLD